MDLFTVGASHKTVGVSGLEAMARALGTGTQEALSKTWETLGGRGAELCVLQTCNRYEIYGVGPKGTGEWLKEKIADAVAGSPVLTHGALYSLTDEEVLRHAFRVASGLESMVIGESEILSQVKTSYETALRRGFTAGVLNGVFQRALFVGKRARTETKLSQGRVSIPSVTIELAQKIFANLRDLTIAVLGAGAMGTETAKILLEANPKVKIFISRTPERAEALAREFGGIAGTLNDLGRVLGSADIVLAQLSVETPVVTVSLVNSAMTTRRRSLFLLDVGLPRNVEGAVARVPNVYLYNLDDLRAIAQVNFERRKEEALKVERIINEEVARFLPRCLKRLDITSAPAVPALL